MEIGYPAKGFFFFIDINSLRLTIKEIKKPKYYFSNWRCFLFASDSYWQKGPDKEGDICSVHICKWYQSLFSNLLSYV